MIMKALRLAGNTLVNDLKAPNDMTKSKFTHAYYRSMIEALSADRRMIFFDEPFDIDGPQKVGILRHDIDICLRAALEVAKIEADVGVKATYFLRMNGTFYNPLSTRGADIVRQIVDLGHQIGLHFDLEYYRVLGLDDREGIVRELDVMSRMYGVDVRTFSQHRPFDFGQSNIKDDPELAKGYAYNDLFFKQMKYISDSGQSWREGDVHQHLDDPLRHLHVLVHPIWWTAEGLDWQTCLRSAAQREASVMIDKSEVLVGRYGEYLAKRGQA